MGTPLGIDDAPICAEEGVIATAMIPHRAALRFELDFSLGDGTNERQFGFIEQSRAHRHSAGALIFITVRGPIRSGRRGRIGLGQR